MEFTFSPGEPLFLLIVSLSIIAGLWWILTLVIDLKQAILSNGWSPSHAVLTEIEFDRRASGEDGEEFRPKIRYSYEVGSRTYVGQRVSYRNQWSDDYSTMAEPFSGLAVGSILPIYVNPERPEQAVVLPGADSSCYLQILYAAVFLGFAVYGLMLHIAL